MTQSKEKFPLLLWGRLEIWWLLDILGDVHRSACEATTSGVRQTLSDAGCSHVGRRGELGNWSYHWFLPSESNRLCPAVRYRAWPVCLLSKRKQRLITWDLIWCDLCVIFLRFLSLCKCCCCPVILRFLRALLKGPNRLTQTNNLLKTFWVVFCSVLFILLNQGFTM